MKTILVTDSLFIFPEHEQQLRDAGYDVVRLDKPQASEDELIEAVKDKAGYILGGIEQVTEKVLDAASQLEAIVFTGTGYKGMIPAWQYATKKGVAIGNVPSGPTHAVAEWAITATLAMTRGVFELARTDGKTFQTTPGLEGQTISIIGLGSIGGRIAEMLQVFSPAQTLYFSSHRHQDKELTLGLQYEDMTTVLQKSDVVFLCVPDDAGHNFFGAERFSQMKDGALLVSFMHPGIIDQDALLEALQSGKIHAASDYPMDERFDSLPLSTWYSFKGSNAFNTPAALQFTSDEAVKTILNLLSTGEDKHLVNPEYKAARG